MVTELTSNALNAEDYTTGPFKPSVPVVNSAAKFLCICGPAVSSARTEKKNRMAPFALDHDSCPVIKNILLLDSEGKRVAVKYYCDEWPTNSAKLAFEKSVFTKTQKTNARTEADITLLDNNIIIYKFVQDLHFFVTGAVDENELILASVLQGFFDAVTVLLRNNVEHREALENLDLILLCLDEIVDGGMVLETDGNVIALKVASHNMDDGTSLSEQTISQALATAREHLTRSLLR
ncbi:unnamed protein product [Cuscuta campestris]|uniref:Coatomer subunit zeta n=2 Tax=Cuscuta sect. Cleistogrammica TaxID=1824901 RepID=A0A484NBG7_9ASTE|nr:hypothetical protein DM860_016724 [Cuscuta australis]VFQ98552.1 unnamed protein product [Cuscuta campestris]